ncbi:unnamed protein product [Amoebophrya sp. A120]|nr:unnamed protein product [Amoebophrya sp. A120]|eukprot:GSA120T00018836001.1
MFPPPSRRFFGATARRNFYQKLDEQHLALQLAEISKTASEFRRGYEQEDLITTGDTTSASSSSSFPSYLHDSGPRPEEEMDHSDPFAQRMQEPGTRPQDFDTRRKLKACESIPFESMRKDRMPLFQDLTHAERVSVQADYKRKLMLDRKVLWLKMNQVPDPKRAARMEMRQILREERRKQKEEYHRTQMEDGSGDRRSSGKNNGDKTDPPAEDALFPPSIMSQQAEHANKMKAQKEENQMRKDELESRKRMQIREWKLANASKLYQSRPPLAQTPTDPILRHIEKRKTRMNQLLVAHLEGFLTNNSSQILHSFLENARITLLRVDARNPKGVHDVYYQIAELPLNRSREWVQERLDTLAPKLRSQLAVKLQLGYAPELRFKHQAFAVPKQNRQRLHRILAKEQREIAGADALQSWTAEMNWGRG